MAIKTLFDPSKDIYRTIEKVISYGAAQQERLKAEISEYIVTPSIEEQLERLLENMLAAMEGGSVSQVAVWVSGFYGSGKSSFTKYLGLALDDRVQIDGVPFLKHLQDRLNRPQTKALLAKAAARFPAAVVLLDLASEMVAGASMESVSTVLYYKTLQWAGYSRNLKVAALERRLQADSRYEEFTALIEKEIGMSWQDVQNDPLVGDSLLPKIAHQIYPKLFPTSTAFTTETAEVVRFESDQVREMLDVIRKQSRKQHVLFILDEVGQYVASRPNLILNLDGLAKNVKDVGEGKAWLFCTAQQTLTEDDPRAALNSPDLFKLKDRFPIRIDLESSDIREICHRRLLTKSASGETQLGALFDKYGQALRHNTKLQDAKFYDSNFDRTTFINLYPFLTAHFDILLHLLGALAKSTGGIGLRSAIKVIQDVLIEGVQGQAAMAERPVGTLVTTVTLYDALERDVKRAFPTIYQAVGKALIRFLDSTVHQEVAKTVAVLQILGNIPITPQNVAGLMHPSVEVPSRADNVQSAIAALLADHHVPLGEKDGALCFFSEKVNDVEQQRSQIPLRTVETRRNVHKALQEVFSPLPSVHLLNTRTVTAGLRAASGAQDVSLAGEREEIQMVVYLAEPAGYDDVRRRLQAESSQRSAANKVYLLGRATPEIEEKAADIYRSEEIVRRFRSELDQEVKEYCNSQNDRALRLGTELQHVFRRCLAQGSLLFRGQATAVESLAPDLLEACKKHLTDVAAQVFDRYAEAPVQAETVLAEKFLRAGNLKGITSAIDPLALVQVSGGTPRIRHDHKALVSLRDYLTQQGSAEGKRLAEHFTRAPFGWSQDTLRYLLATLLVAGEIKLNIGNREVTVDGDQALDALRTNNHFKTVGIALRSGKPPVQVLARAAESLRDLIGEQVIPLEDSISKSAVKTFPRFQQMVAPLGEKLDTLELPGAETARSLSREIADVLLNDGSDATQRLGAEDSSLYRDVKWASELNRSLEQGFGDTVRALQKHLRAVEALPESGVPGELRERLKEILTPLRERLGQMDCYRHAVDLRTALTELKGQVRDAASRMADAEAGSIREAQQTLQRLPEWSELNQEEQALALAELEALRLQGSQDLDGLVALVRQEFVIASRLNEKRRAIEELGRKRILQNLEEERARARTTGKKLTRTLELPAVLANVRQIEDLIRQLQALKQELSVYDDVEVNVRIGS